MSNIALLPEVWKSLSTGTTTARTEWYTAWILCTGVDKVKAVLKRANAGSTFQTQVAYQVATKRTTDPSTPGVLGDAQTDDGEYATNLLDISTTTDGEFYIRFGVSYLTTNGVNDRAEVGLQVCLTVNGKTLSSRSLDLVAPNDSSYYVPIIAWFPSPMVTQAKAVINITQPSADFRCRLAYQTAATRVENPGSWASGDTYHSSGEVATGELALSTSAMWVRLGIEYKCDTGDTNQQAHVDVIPAIRN